MPDLHADECAYCGDPINGTKPQPSVIVRGKSYCNVECYECTDEREAAISPMPDLHALWHEPWCEKCGGNAFSLSCEHAPRPPLAVRLPESVPAGVEHEPGETGMWLVNRHPISDATAELVFIGHNAVEFPAVMFKLLRETARVVPSTLAAALHRLADEREVQVCTSALRRLAGKREQITVEDIAETKFPRHPPG